MERQRIAVRHHALGHEGLQDGNLEGAGKASHHFEAFLRITPFPTRMTGRLRPKWHARRAALGGRRLRHDRRLHGERSQRGLIGDRLLGDIFRQFQMRRPRLFRLGDLKGLAHGLPE